MVHKSVAVSVIGWVFTPANLETSHYSNRSGAHIARALFREPTGEFTGSRLY